MNSHSQEILRRVNQNDPSLTELTLLDTNNFGVAEGKFQSDNSDDYSTLGAAIANNTHLKKLRVLLSDDLALTVANREFYDGLKSNSSISYLDLYCGGQNIAGGVGREILKAYQESNSNLTKLDIDSAGLQNGGDRVIVVDTLRSCRNLQKVVLNYSNVTDAQLLPIVDAIRGHRMLEELDLGCNNIGNVGCDAIATLLANPNCNLRTLNLGRNAINNEGATAIANSLANNNQLQKLYLKNNPIDQQIVQDVFSNILCNVSNINNTYSSNHTLENLVLVFGPFGRQQLQSLLELNRDANKNHVAINKILKYHFNIDMEPLFKWDAEGEQTLKALPYVINWFDRARVAVADEEEDQYKVDGRKLNATFQFARAMPLLLGGIATITRDVDKVNKRKRID